MRASSRDVSCGLSAGWMGGWTETGQISMSLSQAKCFLECEARCELANRFTWTKIWWEYLIKQSKWCLCTVKWVNLRRWFWHLISSSLFQVGKATLRIIHSAVNKFWFHQSFWSLLFENNYSCQAVSTISVYFTPVMFFHSRKLLFMLRFPST